MTGDYPNIGDAIIRREAVGWVRSAGSALVYARDAPDVWVRQVGVLEQDEVLTRGRLKWLNAIVRCRRPVVAFEPGEVSLSTRALPREVAFLLMILIVRVRRGAVVLPPRAVVDPAPLTIFVHRLSCWLATVALWRESESRRRVGAGDLAPDIAFAGPITEGLPACERTKVAVSMRGRREAPSPDWVQAIREWASGAGLAIVTVAQVRDDEVRSADLAAALGGTYIPWVGDDIEHEARLKEIYRESRITISDRLHVLIVSSLSGSIPTELAAGPRPKVAQHFAEIGFANMSRDSSRMSVNEMGDFLDDQMSRQYQILACLENAQSRLQDFAEKVGHRIGTIQDQG